MGGPPGHRRRRDADSDRGAPAARGAGARRRGRRLTMARTPLIAGNWKIHKRHAEADDFAVALLPRVAALDGVQVAVCAPFTDLQALADSVRGSRVEAYA